MDLAVLAVSSLGDLALVVAIVLLWRRSIPRASRELGSERSESSESRWREAVDARFSDVVERIDAFRAEWRHATAQEPAPPSSGPPIAEVDPVDRIARRVEEPVDEASEERRFDDLLRSREFCADVWPRMDGPFDQAADHVLRFLASHGFREPGVESHPAAASGGNHWDYLVLRSRRAGTEGQRFVIPRHYSRYDPALHDHLFEALGRGSGLESFIRELRQCAVLRGSGPLGDLIHPDLLKRKGVFVV